MLMWKKENINHNARSNLETKAIGLALHGKLELFEESNDSDFDYDSESDMDEMEWLDREHMGSIKECAQSAFLIFKQSLVEEDDLDISPDKFIELQKAMTPRYREVAIKFMIQLKYRFNMTSDALYQSITYFDLLLCATKIEKEELQFTLKDFVEAEAKIIQALKCKLSYPNPKLFMRRFLQASADNTSIESEVANFFLEIAVMKYEFMGIRPSLLALACTIVAIGALGHYDNIEPVLSLMSHQYENDELLSASKLVIRFAKEAITGQLKCPCNIETVQDLCRSLNFDFDISQYI